jgi:HAD superfamily hydrolase (TIGR01509 family)
MKKIRGVLLDVDGTLVDSNDAHARAWVKAFAEHGFEVSFEEVRRLIGMGGDKLLPKVAGIREDTPGGKAISKRRGEIFQKEYLPFLRPFPGSKELLRHLHSEGLRLAVASSAKEDELKGLLKVCGADAFIEAHTSSDDAEHSKPEPDIVHAALDEIGLPTEQVILLGDTPYDVEAAGRAGVGVVALRCGGWGDEDLAGALAIYDDRNDLLARYGTSPLAK